MILNSPNTKISHHIEKQFPEIYREEARELISLVEEYYKFVETQTNQSIYNSRRLLDYIDIDRTVDSMLLFFQKKYLSDLPFNESSARFTVKNILDLYRRKGTDEGIRLFFKLFYSEDIEIFYPSENILKPSASRWKKGIFLQMCAMSDPLAYNGIIGKKIYGSISKAEAYVDYIQLVNIYGSRIPILFLDRVRGEFVGLDTIFVTEPTRKNYGRVYGSLTDITGLVGVTPNNIVGDVVDINTAKGFNGKAIITKVSTVVAGDVEFKIVDGDFGYSIYNANTNPLSNTTVFLSNQNFIFDNSNLEFSIEERVAQDQGANTWHYGMVVGQSNTGIGILLDNVAQPFTSGDFETLDRTINQTYSIDVVTIPISSANSARADVVQVSNTQTIEIVSDLIENYLTVPLDAANYSTAGLVPMSGGAASFSSTIGEAFVPEELTVGTISKLGNIFPGIDYNNDVYVLVKESNVEPFKIKSQILAINFNSSPVILQVGDVLQQNRSIIRFDTSIETIVVRGRITKIQNEYVYLKLGSFWQFDGSDDITKENSSSVIPLIAIYNDDELPVIGMNGEITGKANFDLGRIEGISIINSGIGYEDKAPVVLHNPFLDARLAAANTPREGTEIDALGFSFARAQGITEGKWVTKTSQLGITAGKVIQDSDYYQDFSYEITTSLNESEYLEELKDIAHPAGIKLFTKFSLIGKINNDIDILSEIDEELI